MAYILPNGRRLSDLENEPFFIGETPYPMEYLTWPGWCEKHEIQVVPDTKEEVAEYAQFVRAWLKATASSTLAIAVA